MQEGTDLDSPECSGPKALGQSQSASIKPSFNRMVWAYVMPGTGADGSRGSFQPILLLHDAMVQLRFLTVNNL